jgi:hypothetical protein
MASWAETCSVFKYLLERDEEAPTNVVFKYVGGCTDLLVTRDTYATGHIKQSFYTHVTYVCPSLFTVKQISIIMNGV